MVRGAEQTGGHARMVELRAVEPGFPFYGELKLANGQRYDYSAARGLRRPRCARSCSRS